VESNFLQIAIEPIEFLAGGDPGILSAIFDDVISVITIQCRRIIWIVREPLNLTRYRAQFVQTAMSRDPEYVIVVLLNGSDK
jgi:hypothetical protein